MRTRLLALAASLFVALAVPALAGAADLRGIVGPGFTITLLDSAGARVPHLDPGSYTITVDDVSEFHNFHLSGPGVDQATEVEDSGRVVWTVTLTDGRYTYVCDPHSDAMHGSFTVGNVPPEPAPAPKPPPTETALVATVGPGSTISLTRGGKRVARLAAGIYMVTVRDRSRSQNFHLIGPGINRRTGVAARGTFTWHVQLRKGTYRFVSDPHARRVKGSVRVA